MSTIPPIGTIHLRRHLHEETTAETLWKDRNDPYASYKAMKKARNQQIKFNKMCVELGRPLPYDPLFSASGEEMALLLQPDSPKNLERCSSPGMDEDIRLSMQMTEEIEVKEVNEQGHVDSVKMIMNEFFLPTSPSVDSGYHSHSPISSVDSSPFYAHSFILPPTNDWSRRDGLLEELQNLDLKSLIGISPQKTPETSHTTITASATSPSGHMLFSPTGYASGGVTATPSPAHTEETYPVNSSAITPSPRDTPYPSSHQCIPAVTASLPVNNNGHTEMNYSSPLVPSSLLSSPMAMQQNEIFHMQYFESSSDDDESVDVDTSSSVDPTSPLPPTLRDVRMAHTQSNGRYTLWAFTAKILLNPARKGLAAWTGQGFRFRITNPKLFCKVWSAHNKRNKVVEWASLKRTFRLSYDGMIVNNHESKVGNVWQFYEDLPEQLYIPREALLDFIFAHNEKGPLTVPGYPLYRRLHNLVPTSSYPLDFPLDSDGNPYMPCEGLFERVHRPLPPIIHQSPPIEDHLPYPMHHAHQFSQSEFHQYYSQNVPGPIYCNPGMVYHQQIPFASQTRFSPY